MMATTRAPAVAEKLAEAGIILADLEAGSAELALADVEALPGAAGRLRAHEQKISAARANVEKLQAAHRRAVELDDAAAATAQREARRAQLATIRKLADDRSKAMEKIAAAIETAAKGFVEFHNATEALAVSIPAGALPHSIEWGTVDILIDNLPLPATLDVLLGGEMFRHVAKLDNGRFVALPGAKPPTAMLRANPQEIEPATDAVKRNSDWLVGLVKTRFDALNGESAK